MNTEQRKKGSKGVARTELVAVRFDPRTKFGMELASKSQRRSIANYVEWAVEQSFKNVQMERKDGQSETVDAALNGLWDMSGPARFIKLRITYPHLLTFEEQRLAKLMDTVVGVLDIRGSTEVKGELLGPFWDYLNEAANADTPLEEVLKAVDDQRRGGAVTAERIDKRIDSLKKDIAKLETMKKELPTAPKKK